MAVPVPEQLPFSIGNVLVSKIFLKQISIFYKNVIISDANAARLFSEFNIWKSKKYSIKFNIIKQKYLNE